MTDIKRALVLPGGGSKGAYQVGALRRMFELGLTFDVIAGVSVGALNGVMLAMGRYADLLEVWHDIEESDVYTKPGLWGYLRLLTGRKGIYSNEPLLDLLREHDVRAEHVTRPFHFGVVNLNSGDYQSLRGHDVTPERILASTAIPGVWPPVAIGDELWVDGGVRNIQPLGDVIPYDPDEVYILPTDVPGKSSKRGFSHIVDVLHRAVDIMMDEILREDVERFLQINELVRQAEGQGAVLRHPSGRPYKAYTSIIIEPTEGLGSGLDFTRSEIQRRMAHGYERASEVLGASRTVA